MDKGLDIDNIGNKRYIKDYIAQSRTENQFIIANKIGWTNNSYILPDKIYGHSNKVDVFYNDSNTLLNSSGTLEQWKDNIGKYCIGNPILIFVSNFAMSGPLLRPCGIEGGGVHIFGGSSSGKTTTAYVAGSICGGRTNGDGFKYQWRGTSNSFEKIASQHNDLFLILDEIGQATSDTVADVSYMLVNGCGKQRLNQDATIKKAYEWIINFLSTGEMTLSDKIEQNGKNKTMAGQNVRLIDIPIKTSVNDNAFPDIHGMSSTSKFSDYLRNQSCKYFGTVIRELLSNLFGNSNEDFNRNIEQIKLDIDNFIKINCPSDAQSQVIRVCTKFGIIYATGRFASIKGIVPWSVNESDEAVKNYFKIWLENRGGMINQELLKARQRLEEEIQKNGPSKYIDVENYGKINDFHGFVYNQNKYTIYLITPPIFKSIMGNVNRDEFCRYLVNEDRMLDKNKDSWSITKNINGKTVRGYPVKMPIVDDCSAIPDSHTKDLLSQHNSNCSYLCNEIF